MNKKRKFRTASQLLLIALLTTYATLPGFTTAITVSADVDVQKVHQEAETNVSPKAARDIASGTFGTSEWRIDSEGVLHIGAGVFEDTGARSPWKDNADRITKIVFEGTVLAGRDSGHLFYGLRNAQTIEGMERLDTSGVKYMNGMFSGMTGLTSLDLSPLDTTNVTAMGSMFSGMAGLTSLDLSPLDTTNVVSMYSMFSGMTGLTSLDLSPLDTTNVTGMNYMFSGMTGLTSLDLSPLDTSNASMSNMFSGLSGLSQLTLGTNFTFRTTAVAFPSPSTSGKYTGKWINVGRGTVEVPKGAYIWSSNEFISNYDGSKHADTYVWQKDLTAVNVHDSTLQVGGLMSNI